jgi:hypothetical protein
VQCIQIKHIYKHIYLELHIRVNAGEKPFKFDQFMTYLLTILGSGHVKNHIHNIMIIVLHPFPIGDAYSDSTRVIQVMYTFTNLYR